MTQTTKEYAEALFALALETDSADAFSQALKTAKTVFEDNPDYIEMLACYGIPAAERTAAVGDVFGDRLPEYVLSFIQLLCEHGHIKRFFDCAAEYDKLYFEWRRISTVKVISAVELTPDQKARLDIKLAALCQRDIQTVYTLDKGILGGLVIEVDGKVIDGSVKRRLHEVKEVIDA